MPDYLPLQTDVLVFLLAGILYVTDLGRLLSSNEILLVRGTGGKWNVVTPADGFFLNRRFAVLPKVLDPGSTVIRLSWPTDAYSCSHATGTFRRDVEARTRSLVLPRIVCMALLPQIFLGIPICYALPIQNWPLLVAILLIYSQVLLLVTWLFLRRWELGLSWKDSVSVAIDSVVCLPYAINFHRKVGEKTLLPPNMDVFEAAQEVLDTAKLNQLRDYVGTVLDDWLERRPSGPGISRRLLELRSRLQEIS